MQIWEFAAHLYPGSRQEMQTITRSEELLEIPHASPPPIYLTKGGGAAKVGIVNTTRHSQSSSVGSRESLLEILGCLPLFVIGRYLPVPGRQVLYKQDQILEDG